jgi:hypothetical protein
MISIVGSRDVRWNNVTLGHLSPAERDVLCRLASHDTCISTRWCRAAVAISIAHLPLGSEAQLTSHTVRSHTRQDPPLTSPPAPSPPRKITTMAVGCHLGESKKTRGTCMISISPRSLVLILMGSSMLSLGAGRVLSILAIRGGAATRLFRGGAMMIRYASSSNEQADCTSFCQSNSLSSLWTIPSDAQTTRPLFMRHQLQSSVVSNGMTTTGMPEDRSLLRRIVGPERTADATSTTQCRRRSISAGATTGSSGTTLLAEAMVHPALLTHEHPRYVLIVATTTTRNHDHVLCHVLAHRSVERVEIFVVATNETSRDVPLPPRSSSNSLCGGHEHDDPRVTYHYVSDLTLGLAQFNYTDRFDAILVDAMYVALAQCTC